MASTLQLEPRSSKREKRDMTLVRLLFVKIESLNLPSIRPTFCSRTVGRTGQWQCILWLSIRLEAKHRARDAHSHCKEAKTKKGHKTNCKGTLPQSSHMHSTHFSGFHDEFFFTSLGPRHEIQRLKGASSSYLNLNILPMFYHVPCGETYGICCTPCKKRKMPPRRRPQAPRTAGREVAQARGGKIGKVVTLRLLLAPLLAVQNLNSNFSRRLNHLTSFCRAAVGKDLGCRSSSRGW